MQAAGRNVWVVTDGGYADRPFLKPVLKLGVTVVSRLRKDAALRTVPKNQSHGRKYGRQAISLAKRAGQTQGWESLECHLYGRTVVRQIKTFLATYAVAGGALRVVLVKESDGWEAFFCSDVEASAKDILETSASRSSLEQGFADLKQVWGLGEQQVRRVDSNVGSFPLVLWAHTLSLLWGSRQERASLGQRQLSPWDNAGRRPSSRDVRASLRRQMLAEKSGACLENTRPGN